MYTAKEAAEALRVQPRTVQRYVKLAKHPLKAERRGRRKDLLIREDDLIEFANNHGITLDLPQSS